MLLGSMLSYTLSEHLIICVFLQQKSPQILHTEAN